MLRNLPSNHPKIPLITEELKKRTAGYRGETALDFPLSFIAEKDYFIFHDLRLQDSSRYFQMDTLVLSQKFALILEVKNIAGSLYFDPTFN
ncbi:MULTISPECIES: nuclease-related domain-containing protein [Bacillus]|uniref:nuclease-related domain-containing protein n=1 Tax=Bacillus TaxID=1386 RepID=UPI000AFD9491|nr:MULTISPECIES: nuclease-related domain-containing protein [Bacillus]MED1098241.1 nuclease-related domain-containing protein [Bacillus capparidis]